jgi:hypothetical protein
MRSLNGPKGQRSNIFRKGGITLDIFTLLPMGNICVKRSFNLNKRKGLSLIRKISKKYISNYYKTLFGTPADSNISLVENLNNDIPQLSPEENSILVADFSESEVLEAIEHMEKKIRLMTLMAFLWSSFKNSGI